MGALSINDCGTAHEAQLLEIYNGLIDKEKLVTGREPNSLEKSNIDLRVAEAYQSILSICNDGGQISRALELLKERIPTMNINDISKVAVDTVLQVSNGRNVEQNNFGDIAAAAVVGYALGDNAGMQNEINEVPEEIPAARESLYKDLSSRVHEEGASTEEQSAMVAFSYGAAMDTGAELGLKFDDLELSDRREIIKTIKDYLRYGEKDSADFYCKRYGITEVDLENPDYGSFDHLMDTVSPEEDRIMHEINKLAGPIRMFGDYADKMSPELVEKEFERMVKEINASEYPVDAIFKAIDSSKRLSQNKGLYDRFLEIGIEKFNDPTVPTDFDGWLLSYMAGAAQNYNSPESREAVEQITELINRGLESSGLSLTADEVLDLDVYSFQEYISDESRRGQPAGECIKGYAKEKGLAYRANRTEILGTMEDIVKQTDGEPKKVEPIERKRQTLVKMLNTVAKGKGLEFAQERIEELISTYSNKEIAIGAALDFLESQKDSNSQFMSADARKTREGAFEAIVLTGIENPEIYARMQELDRATSKVVVNQVLGQINDSRMSLNKVLGAVQMLGKNLNQRTEPSVEDRPLGFLDPDKTTLPTATLLPEDKGDGREDF